MNGWLRLFRRRLREGAFWAIQSAVLSITALHLFAEASEAFTDGVAYSSGLHQLPVVLYLIPIVYAGLRYGLEGTMLTGAWCIVLTLPNLLLWHVHGGEWLGELVYVSFVVGVGLVVAVPVERERRQREQAVASSRRLALLSAVASELVSATSLDRTLSAVLDRIREVLHSPGAGVAWAAAASDPHSRQTWVSAVAEVEPRLREALTEPSEPAVEAPPAPSTFALGGAEGSAGVLGVVTATGRSIDSADREMLQTIAAEIGVALENARLHRLEAERMRTYVHEVTRAMEEERKHLARELHDTVAQDLVLLSRALDRMAEKEPLPEAAGGVLELRRLAGQILEGIRGLGRDLRPAVLDDLGLVPALEWLAGEVEARTGVAVRVRGSGPRRRLTAETELAMFRIAQEALRNAERHASPSTIEIVFELSDGRVCVEVSDDGSGFSPPSPPERLALQGRLGILGMHERAKLVGGALEIRSRPGEGTKVRVSAPASQPPGTERSDG